MGIWKFQCRLSLISTINAVVVTVTVLFACIVLSCRAERLTFANIKDNQLVDGKRVAITGYMSPLLSPTKNYFYLAQTPYNIEFNFPQENQAIAVYMDISETEKNGVIEYTPVPITVVGTLICKPYIDNNGFEHQHRIINATVQEYTNEDYQRYIDIASAQVYSDVWMYYNLLETIVMGKVSEDEMTEIQGSHLEDMLLYLVMTQYGDDTIVETINTELGLIQNVNARLDKAEYDFTDLQSEVESLKEEITSYFEQWSVE